MSKARRNRLGLAVAVAALFVSVSAPAARAASSHPLLFSVFYFPTLSAAEYFEDPCGVTVRPDGGIYVSDYYHHKIESFDSNGAYLAAESGVDTADGPCGLAADVAGDLFVNDFHGEVIRHDPLGSSETVDPGPATGIAYDPGNGRVYVDDRDHVAVYEESGGPVEVGGEPLTIGTGNLEDGYGVAVSDHAGTEGFVYVADAATDTIKVFDPSTSLGAPVAEIDGKGDPAGGFATLRDAALAVDDTTGDVFVVYNAQGHFYEHPLAAVAEFNQAGEYRGTVQTGSLRFGEPSGIAVDDSGGAGQGRVFVTSGNSQVEDPAEPGKPQSGKREEGAVYAFGPTAPGQRLEVSISGSGMVRSEPAGIACPGACGAEYDEGTTVKLTAEPGAGEVFEGWSGGGCSGSGSCGVTMTAATTVEATFGPALVGGVVHGVAEPPEAAGGANTPPGAPPPTPHATTSGQAESAPATEAAVHRAVAVRDGHRHRVRRRAHRHRHADRFRHHKVRSSR